MFGVLLLLPLLLLLLRYVVRLAAVVVDAARLVPFLWLQLIILPILLLQLLLLMLLQWLILIITLRLFNPSAPTGQFSSHHAAHRVPDNDSCVHLQVGQQRLDIVC